MNLEALSIEDLAAFRDRVNAALSDKVAARQKELLVESGKGRGLGHVSPPQPVLRMFWSQGYQGHTSAVTTPAKCL